MDDKRKAKETFDIKHLLGDKGPELLAKSGLTEEAAQKVLDDVAAMAEKVKDATGSETPTWEQWRDATTPDDRRERYTKRGLAYPYLGDDSPSGWDTLVETLLDDLLAMGGPTMFAVVQVKSKFAGLRFYADVRDYVEDPAKVAESESDPTKKNMWTKTSKIQERISKAEADSYTICEDCGKPGATWSTGYWLWTLCDECGPKHRATKKSDEEQIRLDKPE